jgi:hypothetical protein
MKKEKIKQFIDNKIIQSLQEKTPSEVRQELYERCIKYEKNLKEVVNLENEEDIQNIKDFRDRHFSFYIFLAKQRIIDLYKVETRDIYGWNYTKKFKALLFKEKLEAKATPF